jgi:hypothetical protein
MTMPFFEHRLPALGTAIMSSMAVLLAAFAGASCDFLILTATTSTDGGDDGGIVIPNNNNVDGTGDGTAVVVDTGLQSSSLGILCEHDLYDRDGDSMWELSRIFFIVAVSLGSLTAALAWAVSTYMPPNETNWKTISILAGTTSVVSVPIFVLFESEPCSDYLNNQKCTLGPGSYLLVASVVLMVAVTLITQCLDPPKWALEISFWRTPQKKGASRSQTQSRSQSSKQRQQHRRQKRRNNDGDEDDDEQSLNREVHTNSINRDGSSYYGYAFGGNNDDDEHDRDQDHDDHYYHGQADDDDGKDDDDNDIENLPTLQYRIERVLPAERELPESSHENNHDDDHEEEKRRSATTRKKVEPEKESQTNSGKGRNRWNRWFRGVGNTNGHVDDGDCGDYDVPAVETQSINDEEYAYEDQLDQDRVNMRIIESSFDHDNDQQQQQQQQGRQITAKQNVEEEEEADSMENIVDEDAAAYISPTMSAAAMAMSVPQVYTYSHDIERHHHELDTTTEQSFTASMDGQPQPASGEDILVDLQKEAITRDKVVDHGTANANPSNAGATVESSTDKVRKGVRNLTKKLKRDTKRRRTRRQVRARGYTQMIDDDSESEDDDDGSGVDDNRRQSYNEPRKSSFGHGNAVDRRSYNNTDEYDSDDGANKLQSPPFEVHLPTSSGKNGALADGDDVGAALGDIAMPDISDDEDDLLDNEQHKWNIIGIAKAAADDSFDGILSAGGGGGRFNNSNNEDPFKEVEEEDDADAAGAVDSYYSDPEPSNSNGSFDDIFPPLSLAEIAGDSSTVSSGEQSGSQGNSSHDSRGRSNVTPTPTRSRRAHAKRGISPVGSIKSQGSLLHTTINEETAEDIMKELDAAYALARTRSAPVPESKPIFRVQPKDGHLVGSSNVSTRSESNAQGVDIKTMSMPDGRPTATSAMVRDDKHESHNDMTRPADKDHNVESVAPKAVPANTKASLVKNTWKEPNLITGSLSRKNLSGLPPLPVRPRGNATTPGLNTSDDTSQTEKTDSTGGSTLSDEEEEPTIRIRRSRSMGPPSRRMGRGKDARTTSLSPSRFWKDKESEEPNMSSMARTLRLRRLQKKAGYVSLDDTARPQSPKPNDSTDVDENSDALTPKRKTIHEMDDEKKEDDLAIDSQLGNGTEEDYHNVSISMPYLDSGMSNELSLPTLSDKDSIAQYMKDDPLDLNVDSVLEKLDLELIQVRRPIDREYGADEISL